MQHPESSCDPQTSVVRSGAMLYVDRPSSSPGTDYKDSFEKTDTRQTQDEMPSLGAQGGIEAAAFHLEDLRLCTWNRKNNPVMSRTGTELLAWKAKQICG